MRRFVQVLVVSALVLTACGGDDDDQEAAVDPAAARADADDRLAAVTAWLEADGFAANDEAESEDDDPFEFESEDCERFEEAFPEDAEDLPGQVAEAESGTYERGTLDLGNGQQTVEAAVAIMDGSQTDAVDEVLALIEDDEFASCIEEAARVGIEDAADPGMEFEFDVSTEQLDAPDFVDAGAGARIAGSLGALGFSFDVEFELWMVRAGDRAALLLLSSIGEGGDPVDAETYLELLVG